MREIHDGTRYLWREVPPKRGESGCDLDPRLLCSVPVALGEDKSRFDSFRRSDMPSQTYFVQECPTCGRTLEVRVQYLGRSVSCRHCRGEFVAMDPSMGQVPEDSGIALLKRADELLATFKAREAG